jgi:tRNA(Arg) A34 adenosine deaminase TadA
MRYMQEDKAVLILDIDNITNRQRSAVALAARVAKEDSFVTDGRIRHGAVVLRRGCVVASAPNMPKPSSSVVRASTKIASDHAEQSCISKSSDRLIKGSTLIVVRVTSTNLFGCSMPCRLCRQAIENSGIKRVLFSITPTIFGVWDTRYRISDANVEIIRHLSNIQYPTEAAKQRAANRYLTYA